MRRIDSPVTSSFRDPSGFLFFNEETLYRQVNVVYRDHYHQLIQSGLYDSLAEDGLLIPHQDVSDEFGCHSDVYKIIKPESIPFISYPYEWCFSQLKQAALLTLEIQRRTFRHGMILKDASAYNIQYWKGSPVLIDSLSFEAYADGQPWVAYRQFCQHFLAPLVLMSYRDIRLSHFTTNSSRWNSFRSNQFLTPMEFTLSVWCAFSHSSSCQKSETFFLSKCFGLFPSGYQ